MLKIETLIETLYLISKIRMSEGPFTKDVQGKGGKVLQYPDKFEHREWGGGTQQPGCQSLTERSTKSICFFFFEK